MNFVGGSTRKVKPLISISIRKNRGIFLVFPNQHTFHFIYCYISPTINRQLPNPPFISSILFCLLLQFFWRFLRCLILLLFFILFLRQINHKVIVSSTGN